MNLPPEHYNRALSYAFGSFIHIIEADIWSYAVDCVCLSSVWPVGLHTITLLLLFYSALFIRPIHIQAYLHHYTPYPPTSSTVQSVVEEFWSIGLVYHSLVLHISEGLRPQRKADPVWHLLPALERPQQRSQKVVALFIRGQSSPLFQSAWALCMM